MKCRNLIYPVLVLWWGGVLAGCGPAPATPTPSTLIRPTPTTSVLESVYPVPESASPIAPTAVPRPTLYPALAIPEADATVVFVRASETAPNVWTFEVTLCHPDEGEAHFLNGWDVVLPDNTVLKVATGDPFTQMLAYAADRAEPLTSSQAGLVLPAGTAVVYVQAHDTVHGYGNPVRVEVGIHGRGDRTEVNRYQQP